MIRERTADLPALRAVAAGIGCILLSVLLAACGKRPPPPVQAPAPPSPTPQTSAPVPGAPLPILQVSVEPQRIQKGESALLTWESQHADRVVIDQNIGNVDLVGKIKFFPDDTVTYKITASGPGGVVDRPVTVEVVSGEIDPVQEADLDGQPLEVRFDYYVRPVFFEFDSANLSEEGKLTLDGNIRWLNQPENRGLNFVLEGHCDQRGTEEYNLSLGDKRAQVVREYLVSHGMETSRIHSISYGEERPFETGDSEETHSLNRRVQFVLSEVKAREAATSPVPSR